MIKVRGYKGFEYYDCYDEVYSLIGKIVYFYVWIYFYFLEFLVLINYENVLNLKEGVIYFFIFFIKFLWVYVEFILVW